MQASWSSKTGVLTIRGKQKRVVPRLWSVSLRITRNEIVEKIFFRTNQKVTLTDLEPLISSHIAEFEEAHGLLTEASWVANAR